MRNARKRVHHGQSDSAALLGPQLLIEQVHACVRSACSLPSGPPLRTRSLAAAIDRSPRSDSPALSSLRSHRSQSRSVPASPPVRVARACTASATLLPSAIPSPVLWLHLSAWTLGSADPPKRQTVLCRADCRQPKSASPASQDHNSGKPRAGIPPPDTPACPHKTDLARAASCGRKTSSALAHKHRKLFFFLSLQRHDP